MANITNATFTSNSSVRSTSFFALLNSTLGETIGASVNNSILNSTSIIKTTKNIPVFSINKNFCLSNHRTSFCNYMAISIFLGYFLRLFVIPFVKFRIEKLKHQLRADYNFSLTWLWLIATIPFIDIIEFIASSNTEIYTRTISMFNVIMLVFALYTISVYIYYYGHTKDNYRNYIISVSFITLWICIMSIRSVMIKNGSTKIFNLYLPIYVAFAAVQVFKNTTNKTGRCLTHASFSFWLLSSFFLTSYHEIVSSNKYHYIIYRTFFEISTLVVILLQNIYYRDNRHKMQLINGISNDDQEMTSNSTSSSKLKSKKVSKLFDPFSKEISNSGYLYFKDEDNIIDESKINRNKVISVAKTNVDEDEVCFDKNQTTNKLNNVAPVKALDTIENNDSLESEETIDSSTKQRTSHLRKKLGIFFSYSNSRIWLMVLCGFCVIYYVFAYVILMRTVERSFLLVAVPFVHPIAILLGIAARNCCMINK